MLGSRVRDGRKEWCVASEDCAFGPIGFQRERDVAPGEMLLITGAAFVFLLDMPSHCFCSSTSCHRQARSKTSTKVR